MITGELVRAREDDFANEFFCGPAVGDETLCEEIQQFGMCGRFAGGAEVVRGADESGAEEPEPDAVDVDAGGEWILRVGNPGGEFETATLIGIEGRCGGHVGRGDGEKAARGFVAELVDAAAKMDAGVIDGSFLLHRHDHGTLRS